MVSKCVLYVHQTRPYPLEAPVWNQPKAREAAASRLSSLSPSIRPFVYTSCNKLNTPVSII